MQTQTQNTHFMICFHPHSVVILLSLFTHRALPPTSSLDELYATTKIVVDESRSNAGIAISAPTLTQTVNVSIYILPQIFRINISARTLSFSNYIYSPTSTCVRHVTCVYNADVDDA